MALIGVAISLSACGNLKNSNLANNAKTPSTTKTKSYQTTNTGNGGYTVLMKNGHYVVSPIDGLTATNNDNSVDTRELERGLVQISKGQYSPNSYVFQEGQYLDSTTVNNWLARKSKSNPRGLNPASGSKKNYNPYYLEEILEQDYLSGSGSSYHIGGMSIGLAMNSVDYYQKSSGGPEYQKKISRTDQKKLWSTNGWTSCESFACQKGIKARPNYRWSFFLKLAKIPSSVELTLLTGQQLLIVVK